MKKKFSELVRGPRLLILVTPFVLLAPVWLTGRALYWGTPSSQFIPWWWQAWQTLRSGELPLWNPSVGMGAPLLANYQSALLYPPTWTYFALAAIGGLPLMAWGQALLVGLHLAWAGWGMGSLIRKLGRSELAQTVGGLAFGLSGYLVARAHFLSINATVAWLPWILLMAYELVQEPRNKRTVLKLGLVLALQWLAGHAQIAWYTLMLAIAWTAFWAWRVGGWRTLGNSALRLGLAGLLAFGLSAAQLLPTAEYLANSQRATQVDFVQAATYSFWPWRLIGLVAPDFFGNPVHGDYWGFGNFWEDAIYVGLLPLLLAFAAIWWTRKYKDQKALVIFLVVTMAISFLLALGNNTPLFEWLYRNVPTFALFQSPTRFTIWMVFSLSLLAALAVDWWKQPAGRALYWSRLAVAGAVAVVVIAALGTLVAGRVGITLPQTFIPATLTMGAVGLAAAWLHLRSPVFGAAPSRSWGWLVGGLVAADVFLAGWGLNPGTNLELYKEDASFQAELREELGNGRLYISGDNEYKLRYEQFFEFDNFYTAEPRLIRSSLLPNIFMLDGVLSASNYDPIIPGRYEAFMEKVNNADESRRQELLQAMNVSLVETIVGDETVSFEAVEGLPRARWATCGQIIDVFNDQEPCAKNAIGFVEIISSTANSVELVIDSPSGGWLVLADTFYPGWRAFANGEEISIYPVDGIFRAVGLRAGQYEVKFVYQPLSFYVGAALSIFSWLALFMIWRRTIVQTSPSLESK